MLNLRSLSQREAAAKLGVLQSTLSKLKSLVTRYALIRLVKTEKRKRDGKCEAVDEAPLVWFKQASCYIASINRSILLQKANDVGGKLEDFKATDGWLTRWKERHRRSSVPDHYNI
jgi:hypothetical protein